MIAIELAELAQCAGRAVAIAARWPRLAVKAYRGDRGHRRAAIMTQMGSSKELNALVLFHSGAGGRRWVAGARAAAACGSA